MRKIKNTKAVRDKLSIFTFALGLLLMVYVVLVIIMLVWGLITSLKTRLDWDMNNVVGLPSGKISEWGWENYKLVFEKYKVTVTINGSFETRDIFDMFFNSFLYAVGCSFFSTVAVCLVGYLVAKFDCKFSRFIYTFNLITMVIPIIGATPASLDLMHDLRLHDTFIGMYISHFNFRGMYLLVFFGIFKGLSGEYSDAARIDGAGEMSIFLRIMLPLVKNTFYTVMLLGFIGLWNDYQTVLLYMPSYPTIAYGAYSMNINTNLGLNAEPTRLSACMITCLPLMTIFLLLKNKIMGNLTMGGLKE